MTLHPPSNATAPPSAWPVPSAPSAPLEVRDDQNSTAPADILYRIAALTATLFVVATLF